MAMRISLILLIAFTCYGQKAKGQTGLRSPAFVASLAPRAAAGGGGAISDTFTGANGTSPTSGNWTEIAGNIEIQSNEANAPNTFDFTEKAAVYSGQSLSSVEQYIKVTFTANSVANTRPGIIFRFTNIASPYYNIRFQGAGAGSTCYWIRMATAGGSETLIDDNVAQNYTFPFTVGVTCSGAGNATVIRVWNNPTANAPTSATSWDGGAESFALTDDPSSPVDTGNIIGIGGIGSAGAFAWDTFFGWDIP
jgi:hypothetical protein